MKLTKVVDSNHNVGVSNGKNINWRPQYNCKGKRFEERPINNLWDEVMVFKPDKDFEYEIKIVVKD